MSERPHSIGLVGVGLLGTAIAERLLDCGWQVCAYDVRPRQVEALALLGGEGCPTAGDVFARCQKIVFSLPQSSVSFAVLEEHLESLQPGQAIIDTTTGIPAEMIAAGQAVGARGVAYVEATVAGSSAQVCAGEASLFLGGDEHSLTSVHDVLDAIAAKHFYLGPVGSASRFKLVHNLVLGLNRAALAEGLSFAEALGFEPAQVLEVLRETPAASKVMQSKGRKMVSGDREPQARLSQHLKDVRLIVEAAELAGLEIPLSRAHRRLLEQAESMGLGNADNSAVIEVYRRGMGESL